MNIADRYEMLKNAHVCFRCVSPEHLANKCTQKCSNCNGFHHVTICRRLEGTSANEDVQKSSTSVSAFVSSNVSNSSVSLMPLASVMVGGHEATLLFDSGSDKSYVSQDFVKRVKPKFVKHSDVSYATFGGKKQGSKSSVYEISMKGVGVHHSDKVTVQLPEVPVICLPLGKPKVASALLEEFGHLDLAFDYMCDSR